MVTIKADKLRSLKGMSKERMSFHFACMSVDGMVEEYKFHPTRKWRFDYYHPPTNTAYEYEGVVTSEHNSKMKNRKSRHTTLNGMTNDCDKYNEATKMGIRVYRFTALNYNSIINYLPKNK